MRLIAVAGLALLVTGCHDERMEAATIKRCETLLAAQELNSLPEALRNDPRAPIKPKDAPRISDGENTIFVRRAYDRLTGDAKNRKIEARDYTCLFDKKIDKVVTLSTNGHQQEFRLSDDEWAVTARSGASELHQKVAQ